MRSSRTRTALNSMRSILCSCIILGAASVSAGQKTVLVAGGHQWGLPVLRDLAVRFSERNSEASRLLSHQKWADYNCYTRFQKNECQILMHYVAAGGTANIHCSWRVSRRIRLEGGAGVTSITVTNVNIPDNLGFASGAVTTTRMKETIAIHEPAHALTSADFHGGHSSGDRCAGELYAGSQMLGWCPNHVKLLRDNIGRTYTTIHGLLTDY